MISGLAIFERLVQADCLHVFCHEDLRPECAAYFGRLGEPSRVPASHRRPAT